MTPPQAAQVLATPKLEQIETIDLGGVTMEFVLIQPGWFMMGSVEEAGEGDEAPRHQLR